MTHGTLTTWRYGCRCEECVKAQTTYYNTWRESARQRAAHGHPEERPHSVSTYKNWGCRCDECRAANTNYERDARKRRRSK